MKPLSYLLEKEKWLKTDWIRVAQFLADEPEGIVRGCMWKGERSKLHKRMLDLNKPKKGRGRPKRFNIPQRMVRVERRRADLAQDRNVCLSKIKYTDVATSFAEAAVLLGSSKSIEYLTTKYYNHFKYLKRKSHEVGN